MTRNLAQWDRALRVVAALAMVAAAGVAPVAPWARVLLGVNALYLAFTSLSGTCLGYRLLGASTCPTRLPR
jgi:hypothetical protein